MLDTAVIRNVTPSSVVGSGASGERLPRRSMHGRARGQAMRNMR